jgi:hypothetical protein
MSMAALARARDPHRNRYVAPIGVAVGAVRLADEVLALHLLGLIRGDRGDVRAHGVGVGHRVGARRCPRRVQDEDVIGRQLGVRGGEQKVDVLVLLRIVRRGDELLVDLGHEERVQLREGARAREDDRSRQQHHHDGNQLRPQRRRLPARQHVSASLPS